MEDLLAELVRIDSVNPSLDPSGAGEAVVAARVAGFMREAGFAVRMEETFPGRPNVVAVHGQPSPSDPALLFECHMDTVPLGRMAGALDAGVRDGVLVGRGACDDKGCLSAMMVALARQRKAARRPLVLWATVDEEHDFGGVRALAEQGVHAAGAVVGEPTQLLPVVAHKGCLRFDIRARGRAAHSSRPELGDNAILHAVHLIDLLQRSFDQRFGGREHPLCGRSRWSVTQVTTRNAINVIPDECRIGVDVRVAPGQDAEEIFSWLQEALAESGDPTSHERLRLRDWPLHTPDDADIVRWCVGAASDVMGRPAAPSGVPYGTDASKIAALAHVPAVVIGPGDIAWAHTDDEHIALDDLRAGVRVYEGIIARFLAEA